MRTKNPLLLVVLLANGAAMATNPADHTVPLSFIENQGQAPAAVRFMAKGSGLTAYFSAGEILLRIAGASVGISFEGANPAARVEGEYRLPSRANFLTGEKENWRLNVPVYGAVRYRELYPGIDMLYGGQGRELKSEFQVAAGADPLRIRMRYSGAQFRITEAGELAITVDGQELREEAPLVYQERNGKREAIEGRFDLAADGIVGFLIGKYDTSRPLLIDPVLSYSTLLGGSSVDAAMALAVDASGSAYVAGFTSSYDFPRAGAIQNSIAGGNDVFITKLNPAGNGLVYSTYLGGSGDDRAYGIAVDASGSVYVTGSTTSSNFPVKGALQSKLAGYRNAFVAKLNAAGNGLVYSTYLGGNASDAGNGVAVDASGEAYVVGDTTSTNFPASGFQRVSHGGQEVFVAKLNSYGSQLVWSTYLGGSNDDHGAAIAVDGSGSAYVTGSTWSSDFPVANAEQGHLAGGQDAFVARLSADGKALLFSTYLGGSGGTIAYPESGQGIALDSQGSAYVTGVTSSADFPTLHPLQATLHGWTDAFVTKMSASGALAYSTYLGGSGVETGNAVAVDSVGCAYVVGSTYSTDLPVTNALQQTSGGDYDAFVAKLAATGDSLLYLSYLGGNNSDTATAVALDTAGNVYVAGWTLSSNFPVLNAYQSVNVGNYGAFIAKLIFNLPPTVVGVTPNSGSGASQTFSFQFSDSNGASDLTSVSVLFNSTLSTASACSVTYNRAQNTLALLTDTGAQPATTITPGSGSQQNSQCVLNGGGSSVSTAGTLLTLKLAFTFLPAFSGARNIYMQAISPFGSSSWQTAGTWTIPAQLLNAVAFLKTDTTTQGTWKGVYGSDGYAITNDSTSYPAYAQVTMANQSSWTWVASTTDVRALQNSAGTSRIASTWFGNSFTIDINLTDGNTHQVALYCVDFDSDVRGQTITLLSAASGSVLDVRTISSFAGGVYLVWNISGHVTFQVNLNSGANAVVSGVFFGAAPVAAMSVTPASGSGASQTFSFRFSDNNGATDLATVAVLFNSTLSTANACSVTYNRAQNTLALLTDAGSQPATTITPGSGSQQNSQCVLNGAASSVSTNGTLLTLNLAFTFLPAFNGSKNTYMQATSPSGSTSWVAEGTWTAAFNIAPVSVTPASGAGVSQTFTSLFSDNNGATDLSTVTVLFNSSLNTTNACSVTYNRAQNTLALLTDTGAQPATTITPGSGSLQNSQCVLNGGGSSVSTAGTLLTLKLAFTFLPAFRGAKNIYMQAISPFGSSSWLTAGTWTTTAQLLNAAAFLKTDTTTQGTWKGVYGSDGYAITNDSTSYPAYAQVTMANQSSWTWVASTTDVRALQNSAGTSRIASTWFGDSFTIDINLTDGNTHQVALYCVDFDSDVRGQTITVLNAASGSVLDVRTISSFTGGVYLVWNLSGHVTFRVDLNSGANAVVSGVFLD